MVLFMRATCKRLGALRLLINRRNTAWSYADASTRRWCRLARPRAWARLAVVAARRRLSRRQVQARADLKVKGTRSAEGWGFTDHSSRPITRKCLQTLLDIAREMEPFAGPDRAARWVDGPALHHQRHRGCPQTLRAAREALAAGGWRCRTDALGRLDKVSAQAHVIRGLSKSPMVEAPQFGDRGAAGAEMPLLPERRLAEGASGRSGRCGPSSPWCGGATSHSPVSVADAAPGAARFAAGRQRSISKLIIDHNIVQLTADAARISTNG